MPFTFGTLGSLARLAGRQQTPSAPPPKAFSLDELDAIVGLTPSAAKPFSLDELDALVGLSPTPAAQLPLSGRRGPIADEIEPVAPPPPAPPRPPTFTGEGPGRLNLGSTGWQPSPIPPPPQGTLERAENVVRGIGSSILDRFQPPSVVQQPSATKPSFIKAMDALRLDNEAQTFGSMVSPVGVEASPAGTQQMAQGVVKTIHGMKPNMAKLTDPSTPYPLSVSSETLSGLHDIAAGFFQTQTPVIGTALLTAPVRAAIGLGVAVGADKAAYEGVKMLGGSEESAALAGDIAALFAAGKATEWIMTQPRAAIRAAAVEARRVGAERVEARQTAWEQANAPTRIEPEPTDINVVPDRRLLPTEAPIGDPARRMPPEPGGPPEPLPPTGPGPLGGPPAPPSRPAGPFGAPPPPVAPPSGPFGAPPGTPRVGLDAPPATDKPPAARLVASETQSSPGDARVRQLDRIYGNDAAFGVTFDEEGTSTLYDKERSGVHCTSYAECVLEAEGNGRIVGYPQSKTAAVSPDGHDFAIVQDRYLVDPWAKLVPGQSDRVAYDLQKPEDVAIVRRLYGDPAEWVERVPDPSQPGRNQWVPFKPTGGTDATQAGQVTRGDLTEHPRDEVVGLPPEAGGSGVAVERPPTPEAVVEAPPVAPAAQRVAETVAAQRAERAQQNSALSERFARDGYLYAADPKDPTRAIMLTPSTREGVAYQVTSFENGQPTGHRDYRALGNEPDASGSFLDHALSEFRGREVTDRPRRAEAPPKPAATRPDPIQAAEAEVRVLEQDALDLSRRYERAREGTPDEEYEVGELREMARAAQDAVSAARNQLDTLKPPAVAPAAAGQSPAHTAFVEGQTKLYKSIRAMETTVTKLGGKPRKMAEMKKRLDAAQQLYDQAYERFGATGGDVEAARGEVERAARSQDADQGSDRVPAGARRSQQGPGARGDQGGAQAPRPDVVARHTEADWPTVLADALADGYTGTDADLRAAYDREVVELRALIENVDADAAEHSNEAFLADIRKNGGLQPFDVEHVRETGGMFGEKKGPGIRKRGEFESIVEGFRLNWGQFGASSIFRDDGLSLDGMVEALIQDGRWPELHGNFGMRALLDKLTDIAYAGPTEPTNILQTFADALNVRPGVQWWLPGKPPAPKADPRIADLRELLAAPDAVERGAEIDELINKLQNEGVLTEEQVDAMLQDAGAAPPAETPASEAPAVEPDSERRRRNAVNSNLLEDALSPEAQAALAEMFADPTQGRNLRHIREAMEIYDALITMGEHWSDAGRSGWPTQKDAKAALKDAKRLRDATDAYFRGTGDADDVSAAAYAGLQRVTGEEDPDWGDLLENQVFASSHEGGELIFDTLDPKTASFDVEEFNTAYGDVEFRRDPREVFQDPKNPVNLWEGRQTRTVIPHAEGKARIEEWKAEAARVGKTENNKHRVIISLFDRTGIISQPWVDAGYTVRRFDVRPVSEGGTAEDLTDFGNWMGEVEELIAEGYEIEGVLAQPPCTSFTVSGSQHWPEKHDSKNYEWLVKTYGPKAAEHFERPIDYANTLVAVVKLFVGQANPRFYAMENPVGRIQTENNLPKPLLKFNPDDYGEPYTKMTQLWGEFNPDLPLARVGGEKKLGGEGSRTWNLSSSQKDERSQTPVGFAYAFFVANHAEAVKRAEAPEEAPRPETHVKGDLAEYTGETRVVAGKTGYVLEMMEGPRAGEEAFTYHPPTDPAGKLDMRSDKQIADTLDTGETQPRLEGTEGVRQVGKADTTFKAPQQATGGDFSLEGEGTPEANAREQAELDAQAPGLFEVDETGAAPSGTASAGRYADQNDVNRRLAALGTTLRPVRGSHQAERATVEFINKPLVNEETGITATMSRTSRDKMLSQSAVERSVSSAAHSMALGNLDRLFPLATHRESRAPREGEGSLTNVHHFDVPMPFDGDVLRVSIMAKEFTVGGTRLYLVKAVEIEAPGVVEGGPDVSGQFRHAAVSDRAPSSPSDASSSRFAEMVEAVKGGLSGQPPSGHASMGLFAQPGATTGAPTGKQAPKRMSMPAIVELATEIRGVPKVVRSFGQPGVLGTFSPRKGEIRIHADLFKPGNEHQLAATLSHEIGHLTDWLPHEHLKRGNLLGRLLSLRKFMDATYTASDGTSILNKDVRAELKALSKKWRPWDEKTASKAFKKYRDKGTELYADAISVLFNDPALLKKDAPIFYREFFDHLDRKPEVLQAYLDLMEVLSGTPEEQAARHHDRLIDMVNKGEAKALDVAEAKQKAIREKAVDFMERLREQHANKHRPIRKIVGAAEKKGAIINPDEDSRLFLSRWNYLDGILRGFVGQEFMPIHQAIEASGIGWTRFGTQLMYDRILAGDRMDKANPRYTSPKEAQDGTDIIQKQLTPANQKLLAELTDKFRGVIRKVVTEAHAVGLIKDETFEDIKKNPAYVPFRVVEHIEDEISWKIYKQVGTLQDITNPATEGVLKVLATIRAIERQKLRVAVINDLRRLAPEAIEDAPRVPQGDRTVPQEPKTRDKEMIYYYKKGVLHGVHTDPHIANSVNNLSVGHNWMTVKALQFLNDWIFRPAFTGMNPGFQAINVVRDFLTSWYSAAKGEVGYINPFPLLSKYKAAHQMGRARARGLEPTTGERFRSKMREKLGGKPWEPSDKLRQAYDDVLSAQRAGILGDEMRSGGRDTEETRIADVMAGVGLGSGQSLKDHPIMRPFLFVSDQLQKLGMPEALANVVTAPARAAVFAGDRLTKWGVVGETIPKAVAIKQAAEKYGGIDKIPPDVIAVIRERKGSPDFRIAGTHSVVSNNIFVYSKAAINGWAANIEMIRDPNTRAGFLWKTASVNVIPKLLMFAAMMAAAASDDDDDDDNAVWSALKWYGRAVGKMTEYDRTNTLPIPLYIDKHGNVHYVRFPQLEFGRMVGGVTWKTLQMLRGDKKAMTAALQILDYTAGQTPGLTPSLSVPGDILQYAAGWRVYDPFRGRYVLSEDEADERKAKDPSWRAARIFAGYEFQRLGGSLIWKFSAGEQPIRPETTGQKVLNWPIVSNLGARWYRITNFGETEHFRDVLGAERGEEAKLRNMEDDVLRPAIKTYMDKPKAEQSAMVRRELARDMAAKLYPDLSGSERNTKAERLMKKIALGAVRGHADPLADVLLSARSNQEKAALIKDGKARMGKAEFAQWYDTAKKEGLISGPLDQLLRPSVILRIR